MAFVTNMTTLHRRVCADCLRLMRGRRTFSVSTARPATRQRVEMFRWLDGPGRVFKNALPGSTNYLNAYDQHGGLVRAGGVPPGEAGTMKKTSKRRREEESEEDIAEGKEENLLEDPGRLPKEEPEDLMPFPMNQNFRSQPVLSEELREEIYRRVMVERQDVRTVSASLHVEMRRVGAVVRLKALEKEAILKAGLIF